MNKSIVPIRQAGALTRHDPKKLALFARTVGKELQGEEINEAVEWCEIYKANPFVRDIYFFTFGKYGEEGRRVTPVLSIGLYRKIASRTGNYRPDDTPPRFTYDEKLKGPANPKGIVSCEVSVFMFSHGEWHRVTSSLKWEERAPILVEGAFRWEDTGEVWPDSGKPRKKKVPVGDGAATLDPGKKNWHTMPETMLAKCVEADAIRKAWPEETAGTYVEGDMDAAHTLDLTATEVLEQAEEQRKLNMIGGRDGIIIDWCDGGKLARIPIGEFFDKSLCWMKEQGRTAKDVYHWMKRNEIVRGEVKAKHPHDYLAWQREAEAIIERLPTGEGQ